MINKGKLMKKELEQQIIEIAPYMFRYDGWNNTQNSLLVFGFECGDGWFELIKQLVNDIKNNDITHSVQVNQVKEKFGTLRFYIKKGTEKIFELIFKAEYESGKICEKCGNPGKLRYGGWILTLCNDCNKKTKE